MGHKDWKNIKRDVIYAAKSPDEISFIRDRIALPSGNEFDYVYVDCPYEVVYVVGIDNEEKVLLIRQYRYLLKENVVEIPAGSPEGSETIEQGAIREFEEETGFFPEEVVKLATFYPSSGMTNQKSHIFLAMNFVKTKQNLEESEDIQVEWTPLKSALEMIYQDKIRNVGAAYGLLLADNWLSNNRTKT